MKMQKMAFYRTQHANFSLSRASKMEEKRHKILCMVVSKCSFFKHAQINIMVFSFKMLLHTSQAVTKVSSKIAITESFHLDDAHYHQPLRVHDQSEIIKVKTRYCPAPSKKTQILDFEHYLAFSHKGKNYVLN